MNTKPQAPRRRGAAAIRLLGTMLGVWMLGAIYTPAVAATAATVTVDQQPVTVQPTIPPNITLMLDDSGSMAWDYMPDWGYMTSSQGNGNPSNDQARNSAINGTYYNPSITYTLPPKADSTATTPDLYPNSPGLTNAYTDGFTNTNATDITKYSSPSESFPYYTTFKVTVVTNYAARGTTSYTCPSGSTSDGNSPPTCYVCPSGYTLNSSDTLCKKSGKTSVAPTTTSYTSKTTYSCNGSDSLSGTNCTNSSQVNKNYFTYTTGSSNTEYYVGAAGTCTLLSTVTPTAISTSLCDETAATRQNVANWFSYYSTRIRMAKSGLMTAFSTVSKDFRVGFGSINGGCNGDAGNLPSAASTATPYTYTDTYHCGSGSSNVTNKIASVQPLGDGSSSTDQKNGFWNWAAALNPSGGTPLRLALAAVGSYYQTSQPWTTMSSDPNYGTSTQPSNIACRQAYTILTTDGFWNESDNSSTLSGASNAVWPSISGPNGQSWPTTVGSAPPAPYSGGTTNKNGPSLADVALYYWENDLQANTSFPNEVPTSTQDPAFWQHMVTFTMGLGFTPAGITPSTATTTQLFSWADGGTAITPSFSWPTPSPSNNGSINNIADLEHAGLNGHGGFYSATSPQTFASGLIDALSRAAERVGTGASLAANSTQLTSGTVAYQANYFTVQWAGDLKALSINSSTGAISTTPTWSASSVLTSNATVNGSTKTYPNRTIVTYVPSTSTTGTGTFVNFINNSTTPPALSSAELNALGSSATARATMVNYLRGDNTQELANNGTFRSRSTPLGDVVDSQPVYSGAPDPNEFENQIFTGTSNTATSGDNSFEGFAVGTTNTTTGVSTPSAASTRETLVFVAANDGMLHAFDANSGTEKYAYLPGAVITGDNTSSSTTIDSTALASLANVNYGSTSVTTNPHQYFNDGELTIADVYFSAAWHTVLVGTTGRGPAKAVYALDITNPSSITPLWERSAGDGGSNSSYIGQMVGKPVIAQVANGNWQVLIGNGYNSANGTAALLEFELDNGTLSVHTTDSTAANGLAAPVAWMDNSANGISTKAYAGDLAGRVWEFPLDDATTTTSGTPPVATTTYVADLTAAGVKEFTATDPSGNAQPITGGMIAGKDPTTSNVWVFFGTGEYLSTGDLTNKQIQSWYGLIVEPGANPSTLPALPTTTLSSNMVQRSITYELDGDPSATPPTVGVRLVSTLPTPSDMTGKLGWYMNLEQPILNSDGSFSGSGNAQGERMVTPNQFEGNLLLGTTRIPAAAANADICNSSGSGWVMAVDPFTGTNPTGAFFLPNSGSGTVTITVGGKSQTLPVAGVGFSALPNNPIFVGSDMLMSFDNGTASSLSTSGAMGMPQRVSWQEVVNP